jgi:tetratricopeptide (TPR) repeat protein
MPKLRPILGLAMMLLATPVLAQHEHMHGAGAPAGPPRFEKLGGVHHEIRTTSPEAQRWFDQGLFLCYGFNHAEAIRAFEQAAKADPRTPMPWWGVALALGPNINWMMDSDQETRAYRAMQKALALAKNGTPKEQDYLAALAKRYAKRAGTARAAHDSSYARAMKALSVKYPDDLDAATLRAESMLDLSPWNQWTLAGQPQPGTMDLVAVLESVLKRNPNHIGAIHYYIHTVEAGPLVDRAVPYAERLSKLQLDAGHLVHMPSHIYQRVGRYRESEAGNVAAFAEDSAYVEKEKPQGVYPMMYYPHNVHINFAAAAMEGRSRQAIEAARRLQDLVPAELVAMAPPMEFWCPTIYYALVRFARWDELLKEPAPAGSLRFTTGMWHFGRGSAFAGRGDFEHAALECWRSRPGSRSRRSCRSIPPAGC